MLSIEKVERGRDEAQGSLIVGIYFKKKNQRAG